LSTENAATLDQSYEEILAILVTMAKHPEK